MKMRFVKFALSLSICCTALAGDYIVFNSKYSDSQIFRAGADFTVHATIGLLSSILFFTYDVASLSTYATICNIILCTFLSCFIDVDHAIAARSLVFKDVMNARHRGPFHCTTPWILLSAVSFFHTYMTKKIYTLIISFMVLLAYTSHHVRDANRRGLWVYPFGHTPPISKSMYVAFLVIFPNICGYLCKCMTERLYKHTIVDAGYKMVV